MSFSDTRTRNAPASAVSQHLIDPARGMAALDKFAGTVATYYCVVSTRGM
jgi:hypothetical protein